MTVIVVCKVFVKLELIFFLLSSVNCNFVWSMF